MLLLVLALLAAPESTEITVTGARITEAAAAEGARSYVRSVGGKQPRIYMITSRSGMLDKMRSKMAGADAFLSKPPHPGELSELLAQL